MVRQSSPAKQWIGQEIRLGGRRARLAIGLGIASTIIAIGQIACAAGLLAAAIAPGRLPTALLGLGFITAALLRAGLIVGQEHEASRLGIAARRRLRSDTLGRLMSAGPGLLRGRHSAELSIIVVDRVEAMNGLHGRWIPAARLAAIGPALVALAAATADWRSGLILAATGILVPVFMAMTGIGTGVAARRQFTAMARLQTRFLDRVRGIATIVLAGRAEAEAASLGRAADELRHRTMRILRIAFLNATALDLLAAAALVGIAIRFAGPLLAGQAALAPTALFCVLLVPEFFAPLRAFSAVYQDRMTAQTAAEDLVDLPTPETVAVAPDAVRTVTTRGITIGFEQVSFAWSEARGPVLQDLSFQLPAGEMMMLVGPSGAGKSTIIELLLGYIRPQSGRITLNGAPIETIVPAALARMTALISQRPVLFAGTIEENIRMGRPEASEADLLEAARLARVSEFADLLPEGLATRIGDGGYGLSGGQAQRIAIARAFLKNASLLLLDEPTAQLDPATEREVVDSLRRLAIGRTVVLASHSAFAHEFSGRKLDLGAALAARLEGVA
ncbi:MAG TPA: thiol reductant ABC exporter subunit CydD [Acidiphilium sp.]|jgi:ATP-binding cassette subfamily C protein CydD|uniref:thiol reductant ABC exporter subunit CydD n=1 Tax=unclassified Acidiphilium TaxID=2617493 RepID=UPI000BCF89BB|nr:MULTISPECIES: thiol reductant ABC exporter subunit CydD [unclassified Acidiphilium]OYV56808.1 MAG: thiol reductant ABC exporter subunit CydD [Acidiphilium sp. 20-67-58]HQT60409.1 thiol reductant ABC exporter subunit CydD [Acidiphilium sp.]HQU10055.1 thiol reductant ABC exporter subunit CydD [Acidiphilium sp.]